MDVNAAGQTIFAYLNPESGSIQGAGESAQKGFQAAQDAIKNAGQAFAEKTGETADILKDQVLEGAKTVLGDQTESVTNKLAEGILGDQTEQSGYQAQADYITEAAKGFFGQVAETVSGWARSASNTAGEWKDSASTTVSGWTESASNTAGEWKDSASTTVSGWTESASNTAGEWKAAADTVVADAQKAISDTVSPFFAEGTVLGGVYSTTSDAVGVAYNATSTVVADNALGLGVVGAAVGGVAFANSTVRLLQGNAKNQPVREIAKLVGGAGLVALSVTYAASNDNERSALAITALTSAFAKSVWDAVTAKSPTFYVFRLKEVTSSQPRVVVIPAKIAA